MSGSFQSLPSLNDVKRERAERHLNAYIRQCWGVIEPGTEYMHNWHIDAISEHLEAVEQGQITRLLINMPPRYMKSIAVTVAWPTRHWAKRPESRFISLSYSQMLSMKHNIDRRNIIQSPWYQNNWGDRFALMDDQNTKTKFQNDKMGFMFATSIGGTLTGEGGDFIIVDDPHNPKMAESEAERTAAVEFFKTTLPTRLNDKKKGAIIVVMQRLHEQDISGFVLEQGGYTHLCLPGEAPQRTMIHFPISGREHIREAGEPLWPEREGKAELEAMKKAMGSYGYSGQYDQRPSPGEGGMLKRQWWQYYTFDPTKKQFDEMLQSWDCTFKDSDGSDYVVGQVWGRIGANKYLLDQVRARMDINDTMQAITQLTAKWPRAKLKLVEDKANGPAVIQMLRNKIGGLVPVNPEGGKMARVSAVSPEIEAGNVFLPESAAWVQDFVEECSSFPKGAHDDQVDAMSQAINRLQYRFVAKPGPELKDGFYTPTEREEAGGNKTSGIRRLR
ncbi:MAG: phage terminase large subunit [Cohnella sp.]|nr:phage terminase large subunit [Cohnella sp.]